MQDSVMKAWWDSSHMAGGNAAYVEEMYEAYLDDPQSVSDSWRQVFDGLPKVDGVELETNHSLIREQFKKMAALGPAARAAAAPSQVSTSSDGKQVKVLQLINAYRFRGHQHANLDPLGLWQQARVRDLELSHHNLSEDDFDTVFNVGSYAVGKESLPLGELFKSLNRTYCGSIGAEYMHITDTEQKRWLQQKIESVQAKPEISREEKINILKGLTAADGMEKYLGAKFPGAKRFSLEGGDALIPMLKGLITEAGKSGTKEVVVGMAHRGRLNVLVNVLGKNPSVLFDEFSGKHDDSLGAGDVKYHAGYSSDFATPGGNVHLALAFNPSHLEIVNPVVMGSVRARLERRDNDSSQVLPITIHGDSAIAGQGVVQETFNMSQTRGFAVGGTVRIVINNQVGFTTSKTEDTRSTQYCTDIAKMVQAPIFHVNSDDPEAVLFVTKLALEYRNKFKRDVMIDLVCYRRHGHNEADEPNATQPLMYQKIKKHPVPRQIYADQLTAEGSIESHEVGKLLDDYRAALDHGACVVEEWRPMTEHSVDWSPYLGHDWDTPYDGAIAVDKLKALAESITQYPEDLKLQSRVNKLYQDRKAMAAGDKPLDWGMAENLAYATIVNEEGSSVRMTGQDSGRGTFFHRHAVLHNQVDAVDYMPLQHISEDQEKIEIYDSVLSEAAVMAFEYGYATAEPTCLTIWEAQFGDFANGAQVVFDQFLSSGEAKWGRLCGLTVLLPHGYEGQGPEHSSARLERFLQLCADHNWQVCVPSTPSQVFNMLRRQVVRPMRKPLIVMSPKSLLRHPLAISSMEELAEGVFHNVIGEIDDLDPSKVERVVMCSGKVYYDLLEQRRKNEQDNVAIIRLEQLYPFPQEECAKVIAQYSHVKDWVWCQEEPQNQGAWYCSQHHFWQAIPEGAKLTYAGREAAASPAVGYVSVHNQQQKALVEDALTIK